MDEPTRRLLKEMATSGIMVVLSFRDGITLPDVLGDFPEAIDVSTILGGTDARTYLCADQRMLAVEEKGKVYLLATSMDLYLPDGVDDADIIDVLWTIDTFDNEPRPGLYVRFAPDTWDVLAYAVYQTELHADTDPGGNSHAHTKKSWVLRGKALADVQSLLLAMQQGLEPLEEADEARFTTTIVRRVDENGQIQYRSQSDVMW